MALVYQDGTITRKTIGFTAFGDNPQMTITDTMRGQCVVRIGDKEAVVTPQELLNAARFMGGKDIEIKTK